MDIPFFRRFLVVALAGLGSAQAQTLPDAGALRQQIEQDRPLPIPAPQAPIAPAESVPPKAPQGAVVALREFRFAGNTLLADSALQAVVRDWIGKNVDFDDLQRAAEAVSSRYREAGWVVRSFLPPQDITDGIVTIRVEEARFGATQLDGDAPERLKPEIWRATVDGAQRSGEPLSATALDRALLLLDDLPGVMASGSLAAGQQAGETDLALKFVDESLFAGNLGFDNFGARSTGKNRLTANIGANSPLRIGDRLLANLIHTDGSAYGRLGYTLPVGGSGLRVGANISNLDYRLVGQQFAAMNAEGRSFSWGLEASYPLLRSRQQNVYLSAGADSKQFDNEANGSTTSKYKAKVGTVGLVANQYDAFFGGGATDAGLFVTAGRISPEGAARTDRSDGNFAKLRWNLGRQQTLIGDLSAYAAWNGQWTSHNLDSSEKFYLGGPTGVRAYPVNEGAGTIGHLVNLELRQRVADYWLITGFFDYGRIRQYADNIDTQGRILSGDTPNSLTYKGYGVSLGWSGPWGTQVKATWARRAGRNPYPSHNGTDQDGTLDKDRVWLSVSLPFDFTPRVTPAPAPAPLPPVVTLPPVVVAAAAPAPAPQEPEEIDDSIDIDPEKKALTLRRHGDVWLIVTDRISQNTAREAAATVATVEKWRDAWVSRDATRYLAYYADEFQPDAGLTREQWQKQRRQRFRDAGRITLELSEQRVKIDGDTATVSFKQRYSTPGVSSTVRKTLTLKRVGNSWQIVAERQQSPR